jgi:hypothetical protein
MAQNDLVIANQSFPSFRTDLNSALQAINTSQSGTSRPSGAVSGTIWLDTTSATSPTLKYYDGADDISLATLDHSANTVNWLDSTVSITGLSTTATGTVLTLSDSASTSTVNLIIDNQKEIRFRETTANGTNYIGLKAPASVTADLTFTLPVAPTVNNQALISSTAGVMAFTPYTFPTSDGTASQVLQTNGSGVLSFASAGGGKVLQVVTAHDSTERASSSSSFVTSSNTLSVTITPASASNKIFILVTGTLYNTIGQVYSIATVFRGATDLGQASGRGLTLMYTPSNSDATSSMAMSVLDSPNTTSATTYQVYFKIKDGGSATLNQHSNKSTITAFEIAG